MKQVRKTIQNRYLRKLNGIQMKITRKELRLIINQEINSSIANEKKENLSERFKRKLLKEILEDDESKKEEDDSRKMLGKYAQKILDVLDKFDDEEARRLELLLKDALDAVQPPDLPSEIDTETVKG